MIRLPNNIRDIITKKELKLIDITFLLAFYEENKKQLTPRQKRVIYKRVEQIRNYYNSERMEQKQLVRNDDTIQTINIFHRSIDLKIEEIRPNTIYTDNFRRTSVLEHYYNKIVAFWSDIEPDSLLTKKA